MANDSKHKSSTTSILKEEKKKLKKLAKEEKLKNKMIEKEEKKRIKEEKRKSKEDIKKNKGKEEKKELKKTKSADSNAKNKVETQSLRSTNRTGGEEFRFIKSRFVMPRAQKGYVFPVTPGPARYPITRINYPIMKARRQVDLTKKMIAGPSPPAYTMGIRHTEFREFYNKIQ